MSPSAVMAGRLALLFCVSFAAQLGTALSYTAGVVSFSPSLPTGPSPPTAIFSHNIARHRAHAMAAAARSVQVLAFPEGATGWVYADGTRDGLLPYCVTVPPLPAPSHTLAPDSPLAALALIARDANIVMVTSLCDIQPCTIPPCPPDGRYQYNTAVVFDERGTVVTKYHKSHLFTTGGMFNQPIYPTPVSFTTSFGVRFGLLICFDIEFVEPARSLRSTGVQHFIVLQRWTNTPPSLTATAVQQAWALTHNTTGLLAAGAAEYPWEGGSGIYGQRGEVLAYLFTTQERVINTLLVANVSYGRDEGIDPNPIAHSGQQSKLPAATQSIPSTANTHAVNKPTEVGVECEVWQVIHPSPALPSPGRCSLFPTATGPLSAHLTVTNGSLTCLLEYSLANHTASNETWALMARDAVLTFPGTPTPLAVRACQLLRCERNTTGPRPLQCQPVWANTARFDTIRMRTVSPFAEAWVVLPLVSVGGAGPGPVQGVELEGHPPHGMGVSGLAAEGPLWTAGLYALSQGTQ